MPDPVRFQRVAELFEAARTRAGVDREAFLEGACGDDPSLLTEVLRLLEHHDAEGAPVDTPIVPPGTSSAPTSAASIVRAQQHS